MHGRVRWGGVAALAMAIAVSGCSQVGPSISAEQRTDPRQPTGPEHQQAVEALTRWAAAVEASGGQQVFVPAGDLTGQIGDWELAVGDNNKPALMAGMIVAAVELPGDSPEDAEVRWDDGTTKTMQTISAAEALEEIRTAGVPQCPECHPLQVIGARLSTASIVTNRGPATAPAWEFKLNGTNVVVTRIAVAAQQEVVVKPPPWDANNPPTGISIESATGTAKGTQLTVAFVGAPDSADKPCGVDYTAEAVESDTAIVIIVIPRGNGFAGACSLVGARRTATAALTKPLGDRAVLEIQEGRPVPVLLAP
jgi:hypothetical protein